MILKEEVKNNMLSFHEYDIITEGDYLPLITNGGLLYNCYESKSEFKTAFYECNKGKTALDSVFGLVWSSDYIHFIEDVCGDHVYIKEPLH